jgi:hypothetical protein
MLHKLIVSLFAFLPLDFVMPVLYFLKLIITLLTHQFIISQYMPQNLKLFLFALTTECGHKLTLTGKATKENLSPPPSSL